MIKRGKFGRLKVVCEVCPRSFRAGFYIQVPGLLYENLRRLMFALNAPKIRLPSIFSELATP